MHSSRGQADRRSKGLSSIVDGLKAALLAGELADRIWVYWQRDVTESKGRRRRVVNCVAQTYEAGKCQSTHRVRHPADVLQNSRSDAITAQNMVSNFRYGLGEYDTSANLEVQSATSR